MYATIKFINLLFLFPRPIVSSIIYPLVSLPPVHSVQLSSLGNITSHNDIDTAIHEIQIEKSQNQSLAYQDLLNQIIPIKSPSTISDALFKVGGAYTAHPTSILAAAAGLVLNGIVKSSLEHIISGYTVHSNTANVNLREPQDVVYPQVSEDDAPYEVSEAELRSKIYIPPTFTYGEKSPVILVPGTGVMAGFAFTPNVGRILAVTEYADPVYLNIPENMVGDIQTNAEYIAYATHYISGICGGRNVTLLGWSQASIATRWAHKYWPSTRQVTSGTINISPDYHGTKMAYIPCPAGYPTCSPAALQQLYNSTFIATLRNNGGDSAYVSTTAVYSKFDEVVFPQSGLTASGYTHDAHGVGVTNIYLQDYCGTLLPGGAVWNTHEGLLYNALAVAAALDAIKYGGNADISRIDVKGECAKLVADGLGLADVLATEATIPISGFNILAYKEKKVMEPVIKDYARKDIPAGYSTHTVNV